MKTELEFGLLNSVISFVISKRLLPELSIPAAGQKDRRLWGREWLVARKASGRVAKCIFDQIKANLAENQPKNNQNVQKRIFCKKLQGSMSDDEILPVFAEFR